MKYFLCVIGMIMIIEGLPHFVFPDKIKNYMRKLSEVPDHILRVFGFFAVSLGLFLLFLGRT
ncbi:MAG: DUF2065 domain-containing protein [Syntrophobacterales bacterium]|jgi:uncharacterized protein YjeT (DUF2065 family)|nr:DUF2065 domain-containing protein [Syntrophobacterales bacterium]